MHKVIFLVVSLTLGVAAIAGLVTLGILAGLNWLYVVALWLAALLLMGVVGFYYRAYRRIITRVDATNERITEMRVLQERRYEQLAKRLDALTPGMLDESRSIASSASRGQQEGPKTFDLQHLIAKTENAERKILGRLENLMLDIDKCSRTVDMKMTPECGDLKESE